MLKTGAAAAQVISFHCVMKNSLGQVLSSSFNHDVINQLDPENNGLPGLIAGLQSVKTGEKRSIVVPAELAYGSYIPGLVVELRRSELEYSDQLALGSQVLRSVGRSTEKRLFRVTELGSESVVMDGNHPFAGHDLVFEVEIVAAREADDDDFTGNSGFTHGRLIH